VTSDRRLRVGGWAALLVAAIVPLQLVVVFLNAGDAHVRVWFDVVRGRPPGLGIL
jgi:hypothetical protein